MIAAKKKKINENLKIKLILQLKRKAKQQTLRKKI